MTEATPPEPMNTPPQTRDPAPPAEEHLAAEEVTEDAWQENTEHKKTEDKALVN